MDKVKGIVDAIFGLMYLVMMWPAYLAIAEGDGAFAFGAALGFVVVTALHKVTSIVICTIASIFIGRE